MRRGLLIGTVVVLVLSAATPAHAYVSVGDNLHTAYDGCVAKFTTAGLRDLLDQLDGSKFKFSFVKKAGTVSNPDSKVDASNGKGSGGETLWNSDGGSKFDDGVAEDPCATLYHEMQHLVDYKDGVLNGDYCYYRGADGKPVNSGITVKEVRGLRAENRYRAAQKPKLDPRKGYGLDKAGHLNALPPDGAACEPAPPGEPVRPEEPPGSRGGCSCSAVGGGDPHMRTYDNRFYEFQAVGEFILTRATGGAEALEVQGRIGPVDGLRTVSVFRAAAANAAGDRVSFYRVPTGISVWVGGKSIEPPLGVTMLPQGGKIEVISTGLMTLTWPDTSVLEVKAVGGSALRLVISLAQPRQRQVEGLFGNYDGKAEGDLVVRGGSTIGEKPSFETLYRTFGDSWRIKQAESLFDYGAGQNTDTFTDRGFPDREVSPQNLPNRATAEAVCRHAGVTEAQTLDECILDVGLTGEVAFAQDAVSRQPFAAAAGATLLVVDQPGGEARLDFPGTAGQKVSVDAMLGTGKDDCFPLRLRDSAGQSLGSSCLIGGRGFIDTVTLPTTGQYTLGFKPQTPSQVRVRLYNPVDSEGTIVLDGPGVTSIVAQPGARTRLRFTGTAGERVFINVVSSTLADDCFPVRLIAPNDANIGVGCVINGRGFVDGTVLPQSGQYTVLVDPQVRQMGITQLRLIRAVDQTGQITVDGPAVATQVAQPGAQVRLEFTAIAGQKVVARVASATLPDECFPLQIRDAVGTVSLAFGCVIGGKGETKPWTVPATGTYTVIIDPPGPDTGIAQVTLVRV